MRSAMFLCRLALVVWVATGVGVDAATPTLSRIDGVGHETVPAATTANGRVVTSLSGDRGGLRYQWPGISFETAFRGDAIDFSFGPGDVIAHVLLDGQRLQTLVKPVGHYRVDGVGDGDHRLRIDIATESQAGPNRFDGFRLPVGATSQALPPVARRIEFIGDSHTVGYGNVSTSRECTDAEIWATTDNTRAYGPQVARHFGADYRVNAISGRGIVRNYDGGAGDTLPKAYRYALFDRSVDADDADWQPQVIVIALGTNDFSTALKAGERWATREALGDDYRQTYVAFVQSLRARHPKATFVLWATDGYDGEIRAQVRDVVERLHRAGDERVSFVGVDSLEMGGCDWHPSLVDHARIADLLVRQIEVLPVAPW